MDTAAIAGIAFLASCLIIFVFVLIKEKTKKNKETEAEEPTDEGAAPETFVRRQHKH